MAQSLALWGRSSLLGRVGIRNFTVRIGSVRHTQTPKDAHGVLRLRNMISGFPPAALGPLRLVR